MPRYYRKYRHISNAMIDAAVARVRSEGIEGPTRCLKCGQWIPNEKIINGILPEHYVIGKIPCGWQEAFQKKG